MTTFLILFGAEIAARACTWRSTEGASQETAPRDAEHGGGGAAATLIGRQRMAVLSKNASKALSKSPSDLAKSPIDLLFSSIALHCRSYKKPSRAASRTSGEEPEK